MIIHPLPEGKKDKTTVKLCPLLNIWGITLRSKVRFSLSGLKFKNKSHAQIFALSVTECKGVFSDDQLHYHRMEAQFCFYLALMSEKNWLITTENRKTKSSALRCWPLTTVHVTFRSIFMKHAQMLFEPLKFHSVLT